MIIWITGVAGAGKSTVMREILKKNNIHNNLLILNKSSTLDNYRDSMNNFISLIKENYEKYDYIVFEGLKWESSRFVILNEFIKLKYIFKIFYLNVPREIIYERRKKRGRPNEKKFSMEEIYKQFFKSEKYNNLLLKNFKEIEIRNNINHNDLKLITKEIYELIRN